MRLCLECGASRSSDLPSCPSCGWAPVLVDGFPAYAPELAKGGANFPEDGFSALADKEEGNFWFEARNKLILFMLRRHAPGMASFLEIGCGTGFVLRAVANAFPGVTVSGAEVFCLGLHFARQRLPSAALFQMDARAIPFVEEFDVIGAFDVLEHIEEDEEVLRQIHTALRPGGVVMLSVPQHMWLWSEQDDAAFHVRRYEPGELESKLARAGFRIKTCSSFVSLLLPLMWFSRKVSHSGGSELGIPWWANRLLQGVMAMERNCITFGISFARGGSRFVVAVKE